MSNQCHGFLRLTHDKKYRILLDRGGIVETFDVKFHEKLPGKGGALISLPENYTKLPKVEELPPQVEDESDDEAEYEEVEMNHIIEPSINDTSNQTKNKEKITKFVDNPMHTEESNAEDELPGEDIHPQLP